MGKAVKYGKNWKQGYCRYCGKKTQHRKNSKKHYHLYCTHTCKTLFYQELRLINIKKIGIEKFVLQQLKEPIKEMVVKKNYDNSVSFERVVSKSKYIGIHIGADEKTKLLNLKHKDVVKITIEVLKRNLQENE